ncbi:7tm Odorant receptor [Popillia japonica]|uniref:7tm Odorant receptor n=1 Tax=Popillia japonica TaxID=7064 RepID=A0AAW1IBU0_POPJA
MELKLRDDALQNSIECLKLTGELSSYGFGRFIKIYRLINCCAYVLNIVLLLANLPNAKGYNYIEIVESLGTITHGLVKYICLFYYNGELLNLVSDTQLFWDIREIEETYPMAKSILVLCKRFQTAFIFLAVIGIEQYFLRPLTTANGLIFPARITPDSITFKTILLFSQYYVMLSIVTTIGAYDMFYTSYLGYVIIQLRMLKNRFEHITADVHVKDIHRYINHHQLLLS